MEQRSMKLDQVEVSEILSSADCRRIVDCINSQGSSSFIYRRPGLHTFGAASYLDIKNRISAKYYKCNAGTLTSYLALAGRHNPSLVSLFSGLYTYIEDFFSQRFNVNCNIHSLTAVPGFHLYENHFDFARQSSHIPHFDGQYQGILPLFPHTMNSLTLLKNTISFTIPVSLPSCQGGMRIWDYHYKDIASNDKCDTVAKLSSMKPNYIKYKIGSIVYHSGNLLHQILAWSALPDDPMRITLQGHGILFEGTLYLYW
jgi:hypothetical protein